MLADLWVGKTQAAELFFLLAMVLFIIAAAVAWQAKAYWATAVGVGLASVALGWALL